MDNSLIKRQAAIDALRDYLVGKRCPDDGTLTCRLIENEVINKLPSAEPQERKGKWIDRGEHGDWEWQADGRGKHWHEWECNTCHHYFAERSFFCPHCGSDMREVTT